MNDVSKEERKLCDAVMPKGYLTEDTIEYDEFELTYAEIDLNGDSLNEVIAWESSWAGTSGGSIWALAKKANKYRVIYHNDASWSPIVLLDSKSSGWRDFAFYVQGGGVKETFVVVGYSRGYRPNGKGTEEMPAGKVLIEAEWSNSVFGPVSGN